MDFAEKIKRAMSENEALLNEFLSETIRTESITGNETAVSLVYKKWLERFGFEVRIVEAEPGSPNVLAEWQGAEGPGFVYNGHMDTHPVEDPELWPYPPFAGDIADGYLRGRGTCDMKGGNAAFVMAMKLLKDCGFEPKGRISVTLVCDEQNGGEKGIEYLLKNGLVQGEYGINGEPTAGRLLTKHKGCFAYRLKIKGRSYSASFAGRDKFFTQTGIDAIDKARVVLNAFRDYQRDVLNKRVDPDLGCSVISVTTIQAGDAVNLIAGEAELTIDRRTNPGETPAAVKAELEAILEDIRERDPEFSYELSTDAISPIFDISREDAVVQAVCRAYEAICGCEPEIYCEPWGSDAAHIAETCGCSMPIMGPGAVGSIHDEKVSLDLLYRVTQVYAMTVYELLK